MTTVCTCSHSIEVHGACCSGGACQVCECHCFRGAKRMPKSCRYRLRKQTWRDNPETVAMVFGGVDNTLRELFAEEKAS